MGLSKSSSSINISFTFCSFNTSRLNLSSPRLLFGSISYIWLQDVSIKTQREILCAIKTTTESEDFSYTFEPHFLMINQRDDCLEHW